MRTRHLIFATIALLLQSCYSDIEFKGLIPEPVPVINAVATPDTVVMASISRSYSYEENLGDLYVKDADVELNVNNGEFIEKMSAVEFDTVSNTIMSSSDYIITGIPEPFNDSRKDDSIA